MGERRARAERAEATGAEPAFEVARRLLERAQAEAGAIKAEADGYVRQREQEAELLVAKARRVLVAAEQKAAVIIATARAQAADGDLDLRDGDPDGDVGRVVAPGAARLYLGDHPTRLDRMLAAAIAHAVDDTFPTEATA